MSSPSCSWRLEPSGHLVRIKTGDRYAPSHYSYELNPEPGVLLIDFRSGPTRIPVSVIEGLTADEIRRHLTRPPSQSVPEESQRSENEGRWRGTTQPAPPAIDFDDIRDIPAGLVDAADVLSSPTVREWIAVGPAGSQFTLPPSIAVCGYGPLEKSEVAAQVKKQGSTTTRPGDPAASFLVLGHDGWFVDDIEAHIKARSGNDLFIFSQELLLLALRVGANPFRPLDRKLLAVFEKTHPALQCCREEGFDWMSLDTTSGSKFLSMSFDQVERTPLHEMGYQVGKSSGIKREHRRDILRSAYQEAIPHVESKEYMERWGRPRTRRRLRRMSNAIAWYIRGGIGRQRERGHDMSVAIEDWTADLNWMRSTLYEPWMRFRWPDTKVE